MDSGKYPLIHSNGFYSKFADVNENRYKSHVIKYIQVERWRNCGIQEMAQFTTQMKNGGQRRIVMEMV
jgi:hypothetical protein